LDVGEKRIGIARINSLAKIPEPLDPINVLEETDVVSRINSILKDYDAFAVVVGLPRGLDGQETSQTRSSIEFAKKVKSSLDTKVYMIDEAGTSKSADEIIKNNQSLSRDSVSACIILEDFINYKNIEDLEI
jgi:putative holliday junction resolvase